MKKRNVFIILCFLVTILFVGCSLDSENSVFSEFVSSITSVFESSTENSELSEQESSFSSSIFESSSEFEVSENSSEISSEISTEEFSSIIEHKHEYKEEIVSPTCTEDGYTIHSCECGDSYIDNYVAAKHLELKETILTVDDCETVGLKKIECTKCDYSEEIEFDEIKHDIVETRKEPTCGTSGYIDKKCSICDKFIGRENLPSTGEHELQWSYTDEGHTISCKNCFYSKYSSGHSSAICECGRIAPEDRLIYELSSDGKNYIISKYEGYENEKLDIVVPSTYNDLPVILYADIFNSADNIKSIKIEEGVYITYQRTNIVFDGMNELETIEILGEIDSELRIIYRCSKLKEIVLPKGLIDLKGLIGCPNVEKINIPASVTKFGEDTSTFSGSYFKKVYYEGEIKDWFNVNIYVFNGPHIVTNYCDEFYFNNEIVEELVIPDSVEIIDAYRFYNFKSFKKVIIPSSVKEIRRSAFEKCSNIVNVDFNEGLLFIGERAFFGCKELKEVIFPKGLTTLYNFAFIECDKIERVYFPDSLKTLDMEDFQLIFTIFEEKCNSVFMFETEPSDSVKKALETTIYLPYKYYDVKNSIKYTRIYYTNVSIDDYFTYGDFVFVKTEEGKVELVRYIGENEKVNIPETILYNNEELIITSIGSNAFVNKIVKELNIPKTINRVRLPLGVEHLETINVDKDNSVYTVVDNVLYTKDMSDLVLYPAQREGETFVVPDSVESISLQAFVTAKLKYLYLPNKDALNYLSIVGLDIQPVVFMDSVKQNEGFLVHEWNLGCTFIFGKDEENIRFIEQNDFGYVINKDKAFIVKYYGQEENLFVNSTLIYEGKEYKVLGALNGAFYYNDYIKNVVFEEGILEMGRDVRLRPSLEINLYLFSESICSTIGSSRTNYVFDHCNNLESVTFESVEKTVYCFGFCPKLQEVNFGDNLEYLLSYTFEDCDALEKVELPSSIFTVQAHSITQCDGLKEVIIGTLGMTEQNTKAKASVYLDFTDSHNLETVVLGDEVKKIISGSVFQNVKTLKVGTGLSSEYSVNGSLSINNFYFFGDLNQYLSGDYFTIRSKHLYLQETLLTGELVLETDNSIINNNMFAANADITSLRIKGDNIIFEQGSFEHCENIKLLIVDSYVEEMPKRIFFNSNFDKIIINGGVGKFYNLWFGDANDMTITNWEQWVNTEFESRSANPLSQLNNHLLDIEGNRIFRVELPNTTKTIKSNAFYRFSNTQNNFTIVIPQSVTLIEANAFNGVTSNFIQIEDTNNWYYSNTNSVENSIKYEGGDLANDISLNPSYYWFKVDPIEQ